jgi:hypothetical protein
MVSNFVVLTFFLTFAADFENGAALSVDRWGAIFKTT